MKKLSFWALGHPVKARWIIGVAHVAILCLCLVTGLLFYLADIVLPRNILLIAGYGFCLAYVLYPIKRVRKGLFRHTYVKQKFLDFTLVFSAALVLVIAINHQCVKADMGAPEIPQARFIVYDLQPEPSHHVNISPKSLNSFSFKNWFKSLKSEIRDIKHQIQAKDDGLNLLYIFLLITGTVILSLFLTYLIVALACDLSCSGQEGLSIIVLVLGIAGLVALSIWAIKSILKLDTIAS